MYECTCEVHVAYGGRVLKDVADDAATRARAVARQLLVQSEQVRALEQAGGVRGRRVLYRAVVLQHRTLYQYIYEYIIRYWYKEEL